MKYRKRIIQIILIVTILGLPVYGFAIRSMIRGQVIEAEIGKPIEGAAILIHWSRPAFGPPGLSGTKDIETYETTTDAKGYFRVPKHIGFVYEYRLAIYKKGYVCWNNETIFPGNEDRKDFTLKNNMIIKMERFRDNYNKLDHANFVDIFSIWQEGGGIFDIATEEETKLRRDSIKMKMEQEEKERGK